MHGPLLCASWVGGRAEFVVMKSPKQAKLRRILVPQKVDSKYRYKSMGYVGLQI